MSGRLRQRRGELIMMLSELIEQAQQALADQGDMEVTIEYRVYSHQGDSDEEKPALRCDTLWGDFTISAVRKRGSK